MPVEKSQALVAKWAPRLGLANFRIHVVTLPSSKANGKPAKSWAESDWSPLSEWGVIYVLDDDDPRLDDRTREMTVIHELAHIFLDLTVPGHKYDRAEVERFCNRIARLVLNDWTTLEPDELAALQKHSGKAQKAGEFDIPPGDPKVWLKLVIDSLPARERDVINAVYWERLSLREIAERNDESYESVRRTEARALDLMRERFSALRRSYDEWPE